MADPIDRQWLIERLGIKDDCRECQYSLGPLCSKGSEFVDACEAISDAPSAQPEPRWIPCSERLPEDDTLMLVNYIDHRQNAGDIWIGWHEMENVWYIDGEEHSEERGNEVVAWMPLPQPYERSEDGSQD